MVFCYKIITESPRRRSTSASPQRQKSPSRIPELSSSALSDFVEAIDYQKYGANLLEDIPEREWRLLASLARKRDQDLERQKVADEIQKIWMKEKEERDLIAEETKHQYKNYIHKKREYDRLVHDFRNLQREAEVKLKKVLLQDSISYKEKRSAKQLNMAQNIKAHELVEKALEQEARGMLAADRRSRKLEAEEYKRRAELEDGLRKLYNAERKRSAKLTNTAKRVAISNALNTWDSTILRQEALVLEEFRRAQHAAHAELTTLRSMKLERNRTMKNQRARNVAAFTQQLRDVLRMSKT